MLLVTPLREVDVLERERLLVERGWLSLPGPFPGGAVAEVRIVAPGLALRGLALDTEVAAARFRSVERVQTRQLREREEVRDAAGLLERLVQLLTGPEHAHVPVELLAQLRDLRERPPETRVGPGHAAVVPHESAELPVEGVDGPPAVDLEERMGAPAGVLLCFAECGVRGIDLLRLRRGRRARRRDPRRRPPWRRARRRRAARGCRSSGSAVRGSSRARSPGCRSGAACRPSSSGPRRVRRSGAIPT